MDIKLLIKKWLGSWWGHWCPVCGKPLVEYGYNFLSRCSDPDCPSNVEIRNSFITPVAKKRGRPKKQQSQP